MKKEQYIELLTKYLEGRATAEEENFLLAYYNLFIADADVMELLSEEEKLKLKLNIKTDIDNQLGWTSLLGRETQEENISIRKEEEFKKQEELEKEEDSIIKKYTLWPRIAAAAAVLMIIGAGLFFYTRNTNSSHHLTPNSGLAVNDVKPGGNKAYLTLANGQRLPLTDAANGTIAKEEGVEISKTADGQVTYKASAFSYSNALNIIETPRGGQYQVRLPDGSKVWLNAASKLTYPVSFKGRERREVSLSGEAYFEIFKNKLQPFVVKSRNQEVTVLGTHFNISSYADEEKTKTTLLEGRVKVNDAILKPGEQAILKANQIKIAQVNAEDVAAWKDGEFRFNSEEISSIMRKVSRWYNVQIIYKDDIGQIKLTGSVSRFDNLSKLLEMLENTKEVHFKTEGGKVTITK